MTTTLPNADVLDKVYPEWRSLVVDGSVSTFINAETTGAVSTSIFGLSSPFGSDVSMTPGLQNVILGSPYPNFATSMALSEQHFVQTGANGCFGTIRRTDMNQTHEFDTSLRTFHLGAVASLKALPVHRGSGWVHEGKWSLSGTRESAPLTDDQLFSSVNASYDRNVFTAQQGTEAHTHVLGLVAPALTRLGYKIDRRLPVILTHENYNGQAAGNANHSGDQLTQYDRSTAVVNTGFALPGRKIVRIYTPEAAATIDGVDTFNTSYTRCFNVYVEDNGSKWVPCFFNNLFGKDGADAWIYYGYDGRYIPAHERGHTWDASSPAMLTALYGDEITIDGQTYQLATVNDGFAKTGPMITDEVMGSQEERYVNFTPLLGIPGALNYSFVGDVVRAQEDIYLVDDVEVTLVTYSVDADYFLAKLDYDWYELYYKTGFDVYTPKTSNIQANVLDSWSDIKTYGITVCATKLEYMLTEQMIQALPAYKEYGRARKKACKDNNFMSLMFDDKLTYQQVLGKAKPRNAFMQLTSTTSHSEFSIDFKTFESVKMVGSVPTYVMADGEEGPLTLDDYYQYVLISGKSDSSVGSALAADPVAIANIKAQSAEAKGVSTDATFAIGDGKTDYVTDRVAQSVNGYPIYESLNPTQRTYLMLTNVAQYDSMLLPLIRIIQSLSAQKMWARFK